MENELAQFLAFILIPAMGVQVIVEFLRAAFLDVFLRPFDADQRKYALWIVTGALGVAYAFAFDVNYFGLAEYDIAENLGIVLTGVAVGIGSNYTDEIRKRLSGGNIPSPPET